MESFALKCWGYQLPYKIREEEERQEQRIYNLVEESESFAEFQQRARKIGQTNYRELLAVWNDRWR